VRVANRARRASSGSTTATNLASSGFARLTRRSEIAPVARSDHDQLDRPHDPKATVSGHSTLPIVWPSSESVRTYQTSFWRDGARTRIGSGPLIRGSERSSVQTVLVHALELRLDVFHAHAERRVGTFHRRRSRPRRVRRRTGSPRGRRRSPARGGESAISPRMSAISSRFANMLPIESLSGPGPLDR